MAKEKEDAEDSEAKGGGKKKLIIILIPVLLLLAGAGWFFFLKPEKSSVPEPLPHPTPGAVVKLDSITVNLAGGHFLKFGMALQPTATATEVDGAPALDLAINQFSQMTIDELSTAKGRRATKDELVARIKLTYLPHGTVLSEVTSTGDASETTSKEGAASSGHGKAATASSGHDTTASEHEAIPIQELSAAEAIAMADSLTIQAEVYDLYFTEFVMQ